MSVAPLSIGAPLALEASERAAFDADGFLVLPGALDPPALARVRAEADLGVADEEARMRAGDASVPRVTQLGERYFVTRRSQRSAALRELVLGELCASLCAQLLGPDAYLFIDTFIVKLPGSRFGFGWHQDYGYLQSYGCGDHPPNLSFWAALDDMDEANGGLRVLPFSRGGARALIPHHPDPASHDSVADFGRATAASVLLPMRAGDLVVFSGLLPHVSAPNRSAAPRRAYQWQYSRAPILSGGRPAMLAEPLLMGGRRVARP